MRLNGHNKNPGSQTAGVFIVGAFNRNRTGDLILTMDALYRLSYKGEQ